MKKAKNREMKVSEGTRDLVECTSRLNDFYLESARALNSAFGANENTTRLFSEELTPAFGKLFDVMKGFIAESVVSHIDDDEIKEI